MVGNTGILASGGFREVRKAILVNGQNETLEVVIKRYSEEGIEKLKDFFSGNDDHEVEPTGRDIQMNSAAIKLADQFNERVPRESRIKYNSAYLAVISGKRR